ncbi:hypothetical protein CH63R_05657 [Colletotrichum higginsianum IMI 349063]|uniref:Uncharacterized protein n=1 Tax=Colletotrichum higginsianum (strain IMI 349063) TaxID=759273 RepID=A0A1B7YD45_COLHI|nr:hypothetical protein CH63R_05657 [Colletotrichum higginsianum IMI 349063]OBR09965.1 hypothetical protein CH63R_05657 [Colletotrichum higginsianum IMI 349063]
MGRAPTASSGGFKINRDLRLIDYYTDFLYKMTKPDEPRHPQFEIYGSSVTIWDVWGKSLYFSLQRILRLPKRRQNLWHVNLPSFTTYPSTSPILELEVPLKHVTVGWLERTAGTMGKEVGFESLTTPPSGSSLAAGTFPSQRTCEKACEQIWDWSRKRVLNIQILSTVVFRSITGIPA